MKTAFLGGVSGFGGQGPVDLATCLGLYCGLPSFLLSGDKVSCTLREEMRQELTRMDGTGPDMIMFCAGPTCLW